MNKIKKILLVFSITLLCTACNENDNYSIAIIDTSSINNISQITFYNRDLEVIKTCNYNYAELSSHFYQPQYLDSKVYLVPKGLGNKHNERKIISIDRKSKKVDEVSIDKNNIQCLSVGNRYLYTSSNLNMISYLTQYDIKNKTYNDISFENQYLSLIVSTKENIYCFFTTLNREVLYSNLNIYDHNLNLIKEMDITDIGNCQRKYIIKNDYLYIPVSCDKNDNSISKLMILDLNTKSINSVYNFENNAYIGDIVKYNNYLLISHTNEVTFDGTGLSLFNTNNNETKDIISDIAIKKMEINDNSLYVLDNLNNLYLFDLKNNFKLLNQINHISPENMYISTIIK